MSSYRVLQQNQQTQMKRTEIPLEKILQSASKLIRKQNKQNLSGLQNFGMLNNIQLARKAAQDQQQKVNQLIQNLHF